MSLDSQAYFFFLAIVCGLYFQIKPGFRWALLLGASYLFYFIANPGAFFLIPATTLISYVAARMMGRARWRERRPWILGAAIFWVLGTLIFYKYADVVIEPLNHWLAPGGFSLPVLKYFYPLGLAFYSLQVIGYLIDVYRETLEPERHVGIYALFVCFFPSLIAGPIERAPHLLPQLRLLPGFDRERWRSGLLLILSGLFKKIVLADFFAQLVVPVFEQPKSFSGGMLLLATVVSRYRLYFDFSGYTDMARGSARLFGVDLLRNFNHPFRALSIADFWRRWHMSLSSWMRDYVYYPLITSPARKLGLYVNIIITFTILGLWHAGTACFLLFGFAQGVLIALHDLTAKSRRRWNAFVGLDKHPRLHTALQIATTFFFFACLPMVLFNSRSLADAGYIYRAILTAGSGWLDFSFVKTALGWRIWPLAALAILIAAFARGDATAEKSLEAWVRRQPRWVGWLVLISIALLIFGASVEFKQTEFVYRKF